MTGLCGGHPPAPPVQDLCHPSLYTEGKGRDGAGGGAGACLSPQEGSWADPLKSD